MLIKDKKELDAVRDACKSMVTRRASASGVAVLIPIPGADIGADVAILMEMISFINRKFGLSPEQIEDLDPELKAAILLVAKKIGSYIIGKTITKSLILFVLKRVATRIAVKTSLKWIPIAGQAAAAIIGFGAMKLVGNDHVDDCYNVVLKIIERDSESGSDPREND